MAKIDTWTGAEIAAIIGADAPSSSFQALDFSTDTRTLRAGEVFVALNGEQFRGAQFVPAAAERGAVAAIVEEHADSALPQLQVADGKKALGLLAQARRRLSDATVFAITGSNGKTTTKEILAAIAQRAGETLYTQGNLNNDIGVPLTLLRLRDAHRYAVIEMGANHGGEIAYLAALAEPDVAVITNVASAHLQGFGSLKGVIAAKSELFAANRAALAINLDTPASAEWLALGKGRAQCTFSLQDARADVFATPLDGRRFRLRVGGREAEIAWQLVGAHNVMNALAACASAALTGIDFAAMVAALQGFAVKNSRLMAIAVGGHTVYDDTYNANPASFKAGIAILGEPALVIAGGMAELGTDSAALHEEVAAFAHAQGVAEFWAVGEGAQGYARGFPGARLFADTDSAGRALQAKLAAGGDWQVLVKGSRSAAMERVLQAAGIRS